MRDRPRRRQQAETGKFAAEQRKLSAEASKLAGDRWLAPVIAVASIVGASASIAAYGSLVRLGTHG